MNEEEILEFRKFLHAINNKLAIFYGKSMILSKLLDEVEKDEFVGKLIDQNKEIFDGINQAIELIGFKRTELKKLQGIE
jgi:predicted double-glycine peptidase